MHDSKYYEGYAVVNKKYDIVEYVTSSLPEAIFNAEQFDLSLVNKTWEYMRDVEVDVELDGFELDEFELDGGVFN